MMRIYWCQRGTETQQKNPGDPALHQELTKVGMQAQIGDFQRTAGGKQMGWYHVAKIHHPEKLHFTSGEIPEEELTALVTGDQEIL
mmetsp:Transcript_11938/g.30197  ORF Transcript_11938/g.30197 Transcript_11938/m.30197 type:complete len:86 (-) Transcript_11938:1539-1796(-)